MCVFWQLRGDLVRRGRSQEVIECKIFFLVFASSSLGGFHSARRTATAEARRCTERGLAATLCTLQCKFKPKAEYSSEASVSNTSMTNR